MAEVGQLKGETNGSGYLNVSKFSSVIPKESRHKRQLVLFNYFRE